MNIFVTDLDPEVCAQNLDDKRVIKMILESAQMLSTAMNTRGGQGPYKTTHVNHPCTVWVRASTANYYWLLNHFLTLCYEYTARYGKEHKCQVFFSKFNQSSHLMPPGPLTPFANCTPHKDMETIEAYRLTMKEKWAVDKRPPTWKNNSKPNW
jgi:hypothetical protein